MKSRLLIGAAFMIGLYLYVAYLHIYNTDLVLLPPNPAVEEVVTIADKAGGGAGLVYAALGDSLVAGTGVTAATQTFPYQLGMRLSGENNFPVTVINLGVPGATAADVWREQIQRLGDRQTDISTVTIGVNDVHNRTPLPDFKKDLQASLTALASRSTTVYVMTIPYLGDRTLVWPPFRAYLDWQTKRYNTAIQTVATDLGITVIDLYSLTREQGLVGGSYYSADRFHPSAAGYTFWSDQIYDTLDR